MSLDRSKYRYGTGAYFGQKDAGNGWEPCTFEEIEALRAEGVLQPEASGNALDHETTAILQELREIKKVSSRTNGILVLLFVWLVVIPFIAATLISAQ